PPSISRPAAPGGKFRRWTGTIVQYRRARRRPILPVVLTKGGHMRLLLAGACALLVSGCESMNQKVDASRQDRCQRADWAMVGERDGSTSGNQTMLGDRYSYICGDMYDDAPIPSKIRPCTPQGT